MQCVKLYEHFYIVDDSEITERCYALDVKNGIINYISNMKIEDTNKSFFLNDFSKETQIIENYYMRLVNE
jgi:hypothetical protein